MKYNKNGYLKPTKKLAVDGDGVLLNWEEQTLLWGQKLNIDCTRGLQYIFDTLEKHPGYHQDYWATMPWLKNGKELYEFCCIQAPTYILTAPSNNPLSSYGKHLWINNNLKTRDFALCPAKWMAASPSTLLIDDNKKKCERFVSAGGHAFLYNPDRFDECKAFIQEFINGTATISPAVN